MSTRTVLKTYFETDDRPTQAQFGELIDSLGHLVDDSLATTSSVRFTVVTDATTARTIGLTDAGSYIRFTNASSVTVTVPLQSSVAWAANTEIILFQSGTGAITVAAAGGVTINTPETLIAGKRYATMTLKRVASDEWDLSGNLVSA
jgi:hypothetical protein